MYDIISGIIDHTYQSSYSGDQQYIYSICAVIIVISLVSLLHWIDKCIFKIGR